MISIRPCFVEKCLYFTCCTLAVRLYGMKVGDIFVSINYASSRAMQHPLDGCNFLLHRQAKTTIQSPHVIRYNMVHRNYFSTYVPASNGVSGISQPDGSIFKVLEYYIHDAVMLAITTAEIYKED